jgi:uncharacterized membrane protein YfcA
VAWLLDALAGPTPVLIVAWGMGLALVSLLAPHLTLINVIGFVGGFVGGLMGIGGGILLTPLLLYAPPALGMPALGMHTVAAITMVQVALAGTVAALVHRRAGYVDRRLVIVMGSAMIGGSFAGAASSGFVSDTVLRGLFATLVLLTVVLLPLRFRSAISDPHFHAPPRRAQAAAIAVTLGLLVGLVGAGGGFLLVPILLYVLRVPVRSALGTSLAVLALSALAGAAGKVASGQVDTVLALALVAGALPGAHAGAAASHRLSLKVVTVLLEILLSLVALKMCLDLLSY